MTVLRNTSLWDIGLEHEPPRHRSGDIHNKVGELELPLVTRVLEHLAVHQPCAPGASHMELDLQKQGEERRSWL